MKNNRAGITAENKRYAWPAPLALAVFTFAAFLPALNNGFVNWDDIYSLVENLGYRGLGWTQLKWMFTTCHTFHYQPLTWATYGLDYLAWGMDPFGYHLTNIILHSANALLFYSLCLKLLAPAAPPAAPGEGMELRLSALFAALVFAVHPLRAESVAWISERRDVLSGFFFLLTVILYLRTQSAGGEQKSFLRLNAAPLAAFVLALLSKSMTVTLPAVLLLLDVYPLGRLPGGPRRWFSPEYRRVWLEKIPYFLLSAVFSFIAYYWTYKASGSLSDTAAYYVPSTIKPVTAAAWHVWKTLAPFDLAPLYRFAAPGQSALFAAAALAALTAAALALRRRWPGILPAWAYYLVTVSPTLGLLNAVNVSVHSASDRYSYLPCLGFAALAGAGFRACLPAAGGRSRGAYLAAACLLIAGLALLTSRQAGIWLNSETLWRHALSTNPELDIAHDNLGSALAVQGRTMEAARHYREALRLSPDLADAHFNLGVLLFAEGRSAEAAAHYREALRIRPGSASAHFNYGVVLAAAGNSVEAAAHYRAALRGNPAFAQAHNNLGLVLAGQGRLDEAAAHYREALRLKPDYALPPFNLGVVLSAQGRLDEAAEAYREALRLDPASANAHSNYGGVLLATGKPEEAALHYHEALRLSPDFAVAHYNLGVVLAGQGKREEAALHHREARRLDPGIAPRRQARAK